MNASLAENLEIKSTETVENQTATGRPSTSTSTSRRPAGRGTRLTLGSLAIFVAVFVSACLIYFVQLGSVPLFNPDEALYAEPAREMLELKEYVTTYLNYVVRFTKPPLTIWAQALCMQLFGHNEFAGRFPGAAAGAILVGLTYLFAEKYANRRTALMASLMLMTAPLYLATSRLAITDMPLSLFVAAAVMALFHGFYQNEKRWKWIGYVSIGLAVMVKGPVALILTGTPLIIYHCLTGEVKKAWKYYTPIAGLLLVALIAVPWFAVEIYITKGAYFYSFIVMENFQRFTGVVDHKYGWWYHIVAMLGGFLPWSLFVFLVPMAVSRLIRNSEADDELNVSSKSGCPVTAALRWRPFPNVSTQGRLFIFSATITLFTLIFFSISVSKLLAYTLPAFPMLAICVALALDDLIARNRLFPTRRPSIYFSVCTGLIATAAGAALLIAPKVLSTLRDCPEDLPTILPISFSILLIFALAAFAFSLKRALPQAMISLALMMFTLLIGTGSALLNSLANEWETPLIGMAEYTGKSKLPIIVYGMRKPSMPFYAKRPVLLPGNPQVLTDELGRHPSAYILTRSREEEFFRAIPGCKILTHHGRYMLVMYKQTARQI